MPPSLPSRPTKNPDKLSVSWICSLLDCVAYAMSHPRGDGKTILNQPGGTLRATRQGGSGTGDGGGSAGGSIPAKIVSKDGAFYVVDLYADGYDKAYTSWHVTTQIQGLNFAETLPAGTPIVVLSSFIGATGESI